MEEANSKLWPVWLTSGSTCVLSSVFPAFSSMGSIKVAFVLKMPGCSDDIDAFRDSLCRYCFSDVIFQVIVCYWTFIAL
ncbi:hypothetical protein ACRRTK_008596 [Alexandromys fortis]